MVARISRRAFVAGGIAVAALPSAAVAKKPPPETRRLFDAVTGAALPGVRIIVKRVGGKGKWKFNTDADGLYPFGKIIRAQTESSRYRFRIEPNELDGRYVAYDGFLYLNPGEYTNEGIGDIGLIPLYSEALPFTYSDITTEEEFRRRWLTLLGDLFFAVDRDPTAKPKAHVLRCDSLLRPRRGPDREGVGRALGQGVLADSRGDGRGTQHDDRRYLRQAQIRKNRRCGHDDTHRGVAARHDNRFQARRFPPPRPR